MSLVNLVNSYGVMDLSASGQINMQKENVQDIFSQLVRDKEEECIQRIENGSSEPSFGIGSGSYTESEWKKLLKYVDAAQEKLREAVEETNQENKDTAEEDDESRETSVELLLADVTTATYPSAEKDDPDDVYYTFYTPDGIYCKKQGASGYEWKIPFKAESQYEKVMSYLQNFDAQNNLRFACHENFWMDFLSDQIDMDGFNNFLNTRVHDGVPDYLDTYETGVRINAEAAQYSQYMNVPGFVKDICYTSEQAMAVFGRRSRM